MEISASYQAGYNQCKQDREAELEAIEDRLIDALNFVGAPMHLFCLYTYVYVYIEHMQSIYLL